MQTKLNKTKNPKSFNLCSNPTQRSTNIYTNQENKEKSFILYFKDKNQAQ
jgi:hypothetical protein